MSVADELHDVVAALVADSVPDDGMTRRCLASTIKAFTTPTDNHAVWWNARAWLDAGLWSPTTRPRLEALGLMIGRERDDGWRLVSRSDVFDLRPAPLDLFLAAMAWGFGPTGYGWWRTADILRAAGEDRVIRAVATLQSAAAEEGAPAVWRAWSRDGDAKLLGLGTAFASKLAYFSCFDRRSGRGPLIADLNTAWALWALTGIWDSRNAAALYSAYVEWAEQWARMLGCRPDDIERALFVIGPEIRTLWKQLRRA